MTERAQPTVKTRLIVGFLQLSAHLPLALLHGLGTGLGWLAWLTPNEQRRVAAINLQLCLPQQNVSAHQRLLRRTLIEASKALLELGYLWLSPPARLLQKIHLIEGQEHWQHAVDQGRGAIIITPHLGAWELSGLYLSHHYSITSLYRPSRLGVSVDAIVRHGRERLGAHLVPTDSSGVRALLQALRNGKVVGILPDQNVDREHGVFADFFGQTASTMALVSRLAIKTQAPVFLIYAERLPRGRGYRLRFQPLPDQVIKGPVQISAEALNRAVEQAVRQIPAQYLWSYKRFKTRPAGLAKVY